MLGIGRSSYGLCGHFRMQDEAGWKHAFQSQGDNVFLESGQSAVPPGDRENMSVASVELCPERISR